MSKGVSKAPEMGVRSIVALTSTRSTIHAAPTYAAPFSFMSLITFLSFQYVTITL